MAIGRIPEPGTGIPESIVDAKGDIVTATAADTPARLAVGTNNQTLVAASGEATGLKYANGSVSTLTAKGDLLTATAANTISRLAVGSNGTTLVADSSEATGLKWAAAAGGGKVLQVVQGSYSTPLTISTTTFTDTGLSLAITPTLATSKILVFVVQNIYGDRTSSLQGCALRLLRGATVIHAQAVSSQSGYFSVGGASSIEFMAMIPLNYLDSPSTTSSTTYKIQARPEATSNAGSITANNAICTITLLEIGA